MLYVREQAILVKYSLNHTNSSRALATCHDCYKHGHTGMTLWGHIVLPSNLRDENSVLRFSLWQLILSTGTLTLWSKVGSLCPWAKFRLLTVCWRPLHRYKRHLRSGICSSRISAAPTMNSSAPSDWLVAPLFKNAWKGKKQQWSIPSFSLPRYNKLGVHTKS